MDESFDSHDFDTVYTLDGYMIHPASYDFVFKEKRSPASELGIVEPLEHERPLLLDFLNTIALVNITFTFHVEKERLPRCEFTLYTVSAGAYDMYENCAMSRNLTTEISFTCSKGIFRKMEIRTKCPISIVKVFGFDTFLENYVGCFESKILLRDIDDLTDTTFHAHNPKSCALRCQHRTKYLGLNSKEKCFCIHLEGLVYLKLALCEGCRHRKHYCGNKESYFSVYLTRNADRVFRLSPPSWECFFYRKCDCPGGTRGYNCEFRDCSVRKGNCSHFCSKFRVNDLNFGVCRACENGTVHSDRFECKDFNECLTRHPCSEGKTCRNTYGSFVCQCGSGFIENHLGHCSDIDECETVNRCDRQSTLCRNIVGSYDCNCLYGFERSSSRYYCEDIDECRIHACGMNISECVNTPGSFQCNCFRGYQLTDRLQCKDIDECDSVDRKCPDGVPCINSLGSYDCLCPEGTNKIEFSHVTECDDIDECAMPDLCNLTSSFCLNIIPFYICSCRPGYVSVDAFTCEAKNVSHTEQTTLSLTTDFSSEDDITIYYMTYFGLGFVCILILLMCCVYCFCKQPRNARRISFNDSSLASGTISTGEL